MYKKHIRRSFSSDFSRDAIEGRIKLENKNQDKCLYTNLPNLDTGEDVVSVHSDSSFQKSSPVNYNHPQIISFYRRYGINWKELFIGSRI